MVAEARRLRYEVLARAAEQLAAGLDRRASLELIATTAMSATGADVAVVRLLDAATGELVGRAVAPGSSPLAAELAGSRVTLEALGLDAPGRVLVVPARVGGRLAGALELRRAYGDFDDEACWLAELAGAQLALALKLLEGERPTAAGQDSAVVALERAGEALSAGADVAKAAHHAVQVAAEATGASAAAIWRAANGHLELAASSGAPNERTLAAGRELAEAALAEWRPLTIVETSLPGHERACVLSIQLGQPPFAVLQLHYDEPPPGDQLEALATYGPRAAHALRIAERARDVELELQRTRALLSVVGEAISRLSLAHTLDTAVDRITGLLSTDSVGIYLRENGRLSASAGRGLPPGHEEVAGALEELALGPLRARGTIEVRLAGDDRIPVDAGRALLAAGLDACLAVPLRLHDELIGLFVAYPGARRLDESERTLLAALAAQLAVAVQNARLHERATELGEALGSALESERQAARLLGALYEISRSFAQSLSLETTLRAVTRSMVEVLGVDAAVIRVPSERGDITMPRAVHVADERLAEPVRAILDLPQPRGARTSGPVVLDPQSATRLGGAHALLVPFLERGSTAAVIPIETPTRLLALLTILSLDAAKPISDSTIGTALTIAAQAALAIDNARLYEQQHAFTETIQRALLPSEHPHVPGLELGSVYESATGVEVGGDVYDYLELGDGRLAVVLGDVTGHGVDATADMAMAKFVFRTLVRDHPDPSDLLALANDVVAGEIAVGKFITLACLTIDGGGRIACASAGHPAPRIVLAEGLVRGLSVRGLALGIEPGQRYDETRETLPAGAAVVLYTDGVVEARSGQELYGLSRLDALLLEQRSVSAQELAQAVLDDCRAFAGGELSDDCAVVVVRVL